MAANEIPEALQALAWVRMQGIFGLLLEEGIRFRSLCGFENRIILSSAVKDYPLLILLLEREHNRNESCVTVQRVTTQNDADRHTYPPIIGPFVPEVFQNAPAIEPIHMDWLGPDLTAPVWMPFQASDPVPPQYDLNVFNALAVLQPTADTPAALWGDFVVSVIKMPPIESETVLVPVLPVPVIP
jgi:hypothetical protein